jgi:hypothetical protein
MLKAQRTGALAPLMSHPLMSAAPGLALPNLALHAPAKAALGSAAVGGARITPMPSGIESIEPKLTVQRATVHA